MKLVNKTLNAGGRLLDLETPLVMGVLNVTPDSFYDGGKYASMEMVLAQAEKMLTEGACFLDIGGYSSRPGAQDIPEEEELARVIPAIEAIHKKFPEALLSIDTFRSAVAEAAVHAGAVMVNDISGGSADGKMLMTAGKLKVPFVLMHMRGTPQTMHTQTAYENLIKEILDYFHRKIAEAQAAGITDIILDPGFGFAKTVEQNFELLRQLDRFKIFGKPILAGVSRKSMIWKTLRCSPGEALNGTTALHATVLLKGASILRVHDVKEAVEAVKLINFVR